METPTHYSVEHPVLFRHCDPAGIVFYPRYFEMLNDVTEGFFRDKLSWPFEDMHKTSGGPAVALSAQFFAPSYHGDVLTLDLSVLKLGTTSLKLNMRASCNGEKRFETEHTMVCINKDGKPRAWPDSVQTKITEIMGTSQ